MGDLLFGNVFVYFFDLIFWCGNGVLMRKNGVCFVDVCFVVLVIMEYVFG